MKNKYPFLALLAVMSVSCSFHEVDQEGESTRVFYAQIEAPSGSEQTKVYVDDDLSVLWHADDRVSIFDKNTYNQEYRFTGKTGANAGAFEKVSNSGFVTGNALSSIYSVYPYKESTEISNQGVISVDLPATQSYAKNSFGIEANTMVSVTSDNLLMYKNVGGYLRLSLYGDGISVSSITLKGNNGEKLAGQADVTMPLNGEPSVFLADDALTEITLTCPVPVQLGETEEESIQFWFVLPPVSFDKGFTVTVQKTSGTTFEKVTSKKVEIIRNKLTKMSALEVETDPTQLNNEIWYTSTDGEIVTPSNVDGFGAALIDNCYENGKGILRFDGDVTTIGHLAFYSCERLETVSLPRSVKTIEKEAFVYCYSMTSITIPDSVTSIGIYAFGYCTGLTSIEIPRFVTSFEPFILGCESLSSIIVDPENPVFDSRDHCNAIIRTENNELVSGCKNTVIPNTVTSIGGYAFDTCSGLTTIQIPISVNAIQPYAFYECPNLSSIEIPRTVTYIGGGAFRTCQNLRTIVVDPSNPKYDSRNDCNAIVETKSNRLIIGCNGSFIPNTVTRIGGFAFYRCRGLESIEIPSSVSVIENNAFEGCSGLTSITVLSSIPPAGDEEMFNQTSCPIYVPAESVEAYKAAQYWSAYADRIQAISQPDDANVIFDDANFRDFCVANYDSDGDGEVSYAEAKVVAKIEVNFEVSSLKGIEHFINLKSLVCEWNQLTSLDVSRNTALESLYCYGNQLTSLDVSHNTALEVLWCADNQLTSLDVSQNTALKHLHCNSNRLTSLDVSHNTALESLGCMSNQLKSLDVSQNTALTFLYCSDNQLTSLDVSQNTALEALGCYSNQLKSLDVSQNTALATLYCFSNQLTSLDVSHNTALEILECTDNPALTEIWLKNGQYIQEFSYDPGVTIKYKVDDADFWDYCVGSFDLDGDGEISYDEAKVVTTIDVNSRGFSSLKGIEHFINLKLLSCEYNQLTSLDVSQNTALVILDCHGNQLTSLDVSHNTALEALECSDNQLTSLDVSQNTAMSHLHCNSNQLTSLDVSHNTALESLGCMSNQLKSLDVSQNTELDFLSCDHNQLTSLDVSRNTALVNFTCNSNQLTSLDVSHNTALGLLRCSDNPSLTEIWLKTGQSILDFDYDPGVTIKYKHPDNVIVFEDDIFRDDCVGSFDLDGDGEVSYDEAKVVTKIDVSGKDFFSLKGIEYFINLRVLDCSGNNLTSLDVSQNTALESLNCSANYLTSLDVSQNTALEELTCGYFNRITSLDMSHNTALKVLNCSECGLTSLDVTQNTALESLDCHDTQLTSLDVSHNTALESLCCDSNQLTTLDVSQNTVLKSLWCFSNRLTILDVSHNTALEILDCTDNPTLREIRLKTGQYIQEFSYDHGVIISCID